MSSRTNKSKSTPVKGKSKKQDPNLQLKRQKESSKSVSAKGKRAELVKPVAKIPSSRAESSSNWKALLLKQGKSLPSSAPTSGTGRSNQLGKKMDGSSDGKRVRNSAGSDSGSVSTDRSRSLSQPRCPSQLSMTSEGASSNGADTFETESEASGGVQKDASQVKQEFRALGLSESKGSKHQSRGMERGQKGLPRRTATTTTKKPPRGGLNEFGYFDYSHYGVLKTPITPAHAEFMEDTGIVAMDCEMVGVGPMMESALARVSLVNEFGYCLYDRFVKPKVEVTDYRTQFSGIRENDLKNAVPFQIVAKEVADLLKAHILVGHSLKSDLAVLYLNHPKAKIRDTAFFFKKILHSKTPKLKMLAKKLLGVEIQQGEHSSITDAQATMALYQLYKREWEVSVRQSNRGIDILKLTMDEFRELKSSAVVPVPTQPQAPLYTNSQLATTQDWYEPHEVYNNVSYCGGDQFSACSAECCGGNSTGVSPSDSPPGSMDSMFYATEDNTFEPQSQQGMDDFALHYAPPNTVQSITFMQYPQPPMPPAPVTLPFYQYPQPPPMNAMIIPPMNFPPQPIILPPPPSQFMPHPSMMIPVYRPIQCIPLDYTHM